jgi:uncharacterized protein with HEPN domain
MSRKGDLLYFGHMFDMVRKIQERTKDLTRERFDEDEDLRIVLLHLVQVIGEAARHVSEEGRAAHPEIPWQEVVGMRHKIVHDYMDIREAVLWDTVTRDIPLLAAHLAKFVPADPPE